MQKWCSSNQIDQNVSLTALVRVPQSPGWLTCWDTWMALLFAGLLIFLRWSSSVCSSLFCFFSVPWHVIPLSSMSGTLCTRHFLSSSYKQRQIICVPHLLCSNSWNGHAILICCKRETRYNIGKNITTLCLSAPPPSSQLYTHCQEWLLPSST